MANHTTEAPGTPATPPGATPPPGAATGGPGRAARGEREGWLASVQAIWRDLPGLVTDRVELFTLELQRAAGALVQIVALLVAAAILGVTAWLALWAGIAVGLVELGLHWSLSLLAVLALNGVVAWLAIGRLRSLLPLLSLPATRRHLTPGRKAAPDVNAGAGHEPQPTLRNPPETMPSPASSSAAHASAG